ncbi:hypothetical protein [Marinobacter sp. BSs20148]|uniref:hypothetical protein n=1 Tax=Marinobacter sp. BSs20148 TaxID=490759 RepID=UPI0002777018|nr:hypothetical protein [Marinobacter sp. BSs20148]AFP31952.1 hypothetical protein MRBBS_3016 [Marinobacter sp. BSs20148]
MDLSVPPQPLFSPWFFIPFILRLSVLRPVWLFATKIAAPEQTDFRNSGNDVLASKVAFEGVKTVNALLLQSSDVFIMAKTKASGDCERVQRVFYDSLFRLRERY